MFNNFLLKGIDGQKRFIFLTYLAQLVGLVLNIIMIFIFANGLYDVLRGEGQLGKVLVAIGLICGEGEPVFFFSHFLKC